MPTRTRIGASEVVQHLVGDALGAVVHSPTEAERAVLVAVHASVSVGIGVFAGGADQPALLAL